MYSAERGGFGAMWQSRVERFILLSASCPTCTSATLLKAADKLADPQTDLPAASSLSQESCVAGSLLFLALKV